MADLTHLTPLLPSIDRLIEALTPEDKDRDVRPLEDQLRRGMVRMWAQQRHLVLQRLPTYRPRFEESLSDDELDALWNAVATSTAPEMQRLIDELAPRAMERGYGAAAAETAASAGSTAALMGLSFDLRNPRAVDFLRNRGAERVAGINEATREQLRRILTVAGDNGWSYSRTEREIRSRFSGFARRSPLRHIRTRAELVAVTEIGAAYEAGHQQVISELAEQGTVTEKQWLDAGDERVCPICLPASGQGWIPSSEAFTNGLSGPLGHPGCRCALQTRVAAESRVPTPA